MWLIRHQMERERCVCVCVQTNEEKNDLDNGSKWVASGQHDGQWPSIENRVSVIFGCVQSLSNSWERHRQQGLVRRDTLFGLSDARWRKQAWVVTQVSMNRAQCPDTIVWDESWDECQKLRTKVRLINKSRLSSCARMIWKFSNRVHRHSITNDRPKFRKNLASMCVCVCGCWPSKFLDNQTIKLE